MKHPRKAILAISDFKVSADEGSEISTLAFAAYFICNMAEAL